MATSRELLASLGMGDVFDAFTSDMEAVSLKYSPILWKGQPLLSGGVHYYRSGNGDLNSLVAGLSVAPVVCQTLVDSLVVPNNAQCVFVRDLNVLAKLFESYATQCVESCFVVAPVVSLGPLSYERSSLRLVLDDLRMISRQYAVNNVSVILVDMDATDAGDGVSDSRAAIYGACDTSLR